MIRPRAVGTFRTDVGPGPTAGRAPVSALAIAVLLWVGAVFAVPFPISAQAPSLEYPIKAAYLLNFAKLTAWPRIAFDGPAAPLLIGIVGTDPFGSALDHTVEGKRVNNRRIVVERLEWDDNLRSYHILFVSSADGDRIREVARRVAGRPALIVAETPDAAERGAIINFTIEGGRVRFEANVEAARRARLEISSQVLAYATIVKDR